MTSRAWARSGSRPAAAGGRQDPRPAESWGIAVDRARRWWDSLAGAPDGGRYSDVATAAILSTAAVLWADVARELGEGDGG